MSVPPPHYLLFSQAHSSPASGPGSGGRWHFVLQSLAGETELEAADIEPAPADRLELLAVVRGLEALEQPSRVTLVTPSKYVCHGLRFGVEEWRENGFQWERFGELKPIKNCDLWKRLDQALQIHAVDCRTWRLETNDDLSTPEGTELPAARPKKRNIRIDSAHSSEGKAKKTAEVFSEPLWARFEALWQWMNPKRAVKEESKRSSAGRRRRRSPVPR
jgi:ribonuclease HI